MITPVNIPPRLPEHLIKYNLGYLALDQLLREVMLLHKEIVVWAEVNVEKV